MPKHRPTRRAARGVEAATQAVATRGRPRRQPSSTTEDGEQEDTNPTTPTTPTSTPTPSGVNEVMLTTLQRMEASQAMLVERISFLEERLATQTRGFLPGEAGPSGATAAPCIQTDAPAPLPLSHTAQSPPLGPMSPNTYQQRQPAIAPAAQICQDLTGIRQMGVPVDLFIDDKTKQKIWENEAIDLAVLVKKAKLKTGDDECGEPDIAELKCREWDDAWNIFQAIYLKKYTHQSYKDGLATHKQYVSQLMSKGNWAAYDIQFRRMVQKGLCVWGEMCAPLYTSAYLAGARDTPQAHLPKKNQNPGKKSHSVPRGWCIDYHHRGACNRSNCLFSHLCHHCHKEHSAKMCPTPGQANGKGPKPQGQNQSFRKGGPGRQGPSNSN